MSSSASITRGKYPPNNVTKDHNIRQNRQNRQNKNMDLGFKPEDEVSSVDSEFTPNVRNTQVITPEAINARLIMCILNKLSSQKLIQGNYKFNCMLIRERIMLFVNRVYDSNKNKEYSRGTIFALLALRGAIPHFEELITPQIKNNNGILAKFEKIMQKANQKYIDEWNDITNKIVTSDLGFGQQYDLAAIRKQCGRIKFLLSPYLTKINPYQINHENQPSLTTVKHNQIKRRNQRHLPKIVEEHPEYDYNEFSDDGEFKEN